MSQIIYLFKKPVADHNMSFFENFVKSFLTFHYSNNAFFEFSYQSNNKKRGCRQRQSIVLGWTISSKRSVSLFFKLIVFMIYLAIWSVITRYHSACWLIYVSHVKIWRSYKVNASLRNLCFNIRLSNMIKGVYGVYSVFLRWASWVKSKSCDFRTSKCGPISLCLTFLKFKYLVSCS